MDNNPLDTILAKTKYNVKNTHEKKNNHPRRYNTPNSFKWRYEIENLKPTIKWFVALPENYLLNQICNHVEKAGLIYY